ncbi:11172_t:CDS:2 [Paraglomus occultum]|uniref:11172_t:CDS:1 n=1 Tax=Paraglomus occultum TaxID=144539 RepID=A0A9N9A9C3_9GLOM|nr:11172_t:CDS:2 [Paraglomus occultum]
MLLYFVQTSAVFHTGCWNERKNKKARISRASKKEYEIKQEKPELVRVRQWADEDDFRLFVYLKLDELIQNGQAGVEAVEEGEESNLEDNNKRDNQDNRTKTVNITYINGDNSNTTTDTITASSMNTNISTSATTIKATAATAEITQNTDKINKKIESLILEGTRALQSDWRDFSKQDRAYDNIDDVGVDLDYFTFLASIPDALKKMEHQKGAWAVAIERFRILRTFLRGLI